LSCSIRFASCLVPCHAWMPWPRGPSDSQTTTCRIPAVLCTLRPFCKVCLGPTDRSGALDRAHLGAVGFTDAEALNQRRPPAHTLSPTCGGFGVGSVIASGVGAVARPVRIAIDHCVIATHMQPLSCGRDARLSGSSGSDRSRSNVLPWLDYPCEYSGLTPPSSPERTPQSVDCSSRPLLTSDD